MGMAYPPPMMPNEFAGETTQSHRSWSAGRLDNVPWSTVKCVCNFDGRAVIARVHASTSDSPRTEVDSAREGEISMKWGNSKFRRGSCTFEFMDRDRFCACSCLNQQSTTVINTANYAI